VAVWGRGVDTHVFNPSRRDGGWRRWLAGGDDTAIVLHVGRLAPEKNLDVLIESWRVAHQALGQRATFVVAGEGPVARRIATRLPFVRLLGFLPIQHLATLYASADLCVFTSSTETCGLVALEAMSSGVPVIAADAGGFRESVVPNETGLLVPPDDPRGFVEAILELVGDSRRRFLLAAAARERRSAPAVPCSCGIAGSAPPPCWRTPGRTSSCSSSSVPSSAPARAMRAACRWRWSTCRTSIPSPPVTPRQPPPSLPWWRSRIRCSHPSSFPC